jgi:glycosyltransferase involved in cell wall biosynthesis
MKVAIYHNLPSGGGKRALSEFARLLAARHELDCYSLSTSEEDLCDFRDSCRRSVAYDFRPLPLATRPLGRLNQGIRALDLLRLYALQKRVAADVDKGGYDAVLVNPCQFSTSPQLLKYLRTPSVYYCQEPPRLVCEPQPYRPYGRLSGFQRVINLIDPLPALYRRVLRESDRANLLSATLVLVNSRYSHESVYRTYGVFAHVSPLGVDSRRFRPTLGQRENYVVSVGALAPNKGFDWIIRSLAEIDPVRRPKLVLVSNFTNDLEHSYLASLGHELGVTVEFRNRVSDEELVELYGRALATAYAPIMEPFGFVPLESMACGTPVVGVNEAGVRESVTHAETGLLVDRDVHALAGAIERLIADPALREELGRKGRQHVVENWGWDRSAAILESFLDQAARVRP